MRNNFNCSIVVVTDEACKTPILSLLVFDWAIIKNQKFDSVSYIVYYAYQLLTFVRDIVCAEFVITVKLNSLLFTLED